MGRSAVGEVSELRAWWGALCGVYSRCVLGGWVMCAPLVGCVVSYRIVRSRARLLYSYCAELLSIHASAAPASICIVAHLSCVRQVQTSQVDGCAISTRSLDEQYPQKVSLSALTRPRRPSYMCSKTTARPPTRATCTRYSTSPSDDASRRTTLTLPSCWRHSCAKFSRERLNS